MQTAEELTEAAADVVAQAAAQGVVWLELRACPDLHTREGLSRAAALSAIVAGFAEGQRRAVTRSLGRVEARARPGCPHPTRARER